MTDTKQDIINSLQTTLDAFIDRFLESDDYIKKKITLDVFKTSVEQLCAQLPTSFSGPLKKHAFARIDAAQATSVLADMQHRIANGDLLPISSGTLSDADYKYKELYEHVYAQQNQARTELWENEVLRRQQNEGMWKQHDSQSDLERMYNKPQKPYIWP